MGVMFAKWLHQNLKFDQTTNTFFVSFSRLILEFSDDVSSRFHGHGASVYGDEVTGGAIIGEMYYKDVKDEINLVDEEISDKQIEIWSANYAGTTHGNRLDHDDRQGPMN